MRHYNIPEFTVGEFSRNLKRIVEDAFGYVRIRGEISGLKKASSGHLYFSIKDDKAILSAVCFKNMADLITFEIADGLEVTLSGKITTYEGRSNYQIIVEKVEIVGIGSLMELIEKRRIKLLNEGLFDPQHKKALPKFPRVIGVITSATGAVIEDIKHRISERFPVQLLLYPAAVQGKNAAREIILGLEYFNNSDSKLRPDLIIIARGGGSFEDLLPFNDEELARAVFKSKIVIISAVGHETDTTLIDYVSDFRAPTPSAAAELATPVLSDLKKSLENLQRRLTNYVDNNLTNKSSNLENLAKHLIHPRELLKQLEKHYQHLVLQLKTSVENQLNNKSQRLLATGNLLAKPQLENYQNKLDFFAKDIKSAAFKIIKHEQERINLATKLLGSYHYKNVLDRGYAMVRNNSNQLITSSLVTKNDDEISVEFFDGTIEAVVKRNIS